MNTAKEQVIEYLTAKRESALIDGDSKTAYNLTCWLNFVNRKATRADVAQVAYQVKQDKAAQPSSQLTLF